MNIPNHSKSQKQDTDTGISKRQTVTFFPDSGVVFKLKFHKQTFELKVNHKDDVMTGQLYHLYHFREGDQIIVTKKGKNSYILEAPDTEPYPELD